MNTTEAKKSKNYFYLKNSYYKKKGLFEKIKL